MYISVDFLKIFKNYLTSKIYNLCIDAISSLANIHRIRAFIALTVTFTTAACGGSAAMDNYKVRDFDSMVGGQMVIGEWIKTCSALICTLSVRSKENPNIVLCMEISKRIDKLRYPAYTSIIARNSLINSSDSIIYTDDWSSIEMRPLESDQRAVFTISLSDVNSSLLLSDNVTVTINGAPLTFQTAGLSEAIIDANETAGSPLDLAALSDRKIKWATRPTPAAVAPATSAPALSISESGPSAPTSDSSHSANSLLSGVGPETLAVIGSALSGVAAVIGAINGRGGSAPGSSAGRGCRPIDATCVPGQPCAPRC